MLLDLRVRTCDLGALTILNTELNDLRLIICLRIERVSVCKVIENLVEHGRHCLPCSSKF